jgi:mono/diheme cytochrome c family protein
MTDRTPRDLRRHLPSAPFVVVAALIVGGLAGALIYAGIYNIGADAPHTGPVYWMIENLRDRSIAVRARGISAPPDLDDQKRIATGAGLYAEMCSGCHLAPGMEKTEISQGLYPRAPELSREMHLTPSEEFWAIKHGVKLTGMPAWGLTHDDTLLWDIVAFLRKLPSLTPAQYQAIVKSAPESHEEMMRNMPGMRRDADGDKEHRE